MNIKHMNIFLTVCGCGNNITQAAKKLFMTQPAVTVAIQEIEKHYGILLFDRLGRRLYLTEAGKEFKEYAMRIVALFDDMEKGFRDWDTAGIMRIGASVTIGSQFMPSYVEIFSKLNPKVDVRVLIAPSDELEQKIMNNEIDLALVESYIHGENIIAEEYMEDSLVVITPAKEPYYPGQIMKKEAFKSQRFLLREHGSGARELFERVMQSNELNIKPVWEGMSTTALVNAVSKGLGISVLPRRMVTGALEKGSIYRVRVEGMEFRRKFYIVHHKDKRITKMMSEFIELCKNFELDYPLPKYNDLL